MSGEREPVDFEGVRRAGRAVDCALHLVRSACLPGVAVSALDRIAAESIEKDGAVSSMLGYTDGHGGGAFPLHLSVSVNNEIAGGCDANRVIAFGDLVTIDLAAAVKGWHADAAISWCVGGQEASGRRADLAKAARAVTMAGFLALGQTPDWAVVLDRMGEAAAELGVVILKGFDGHGIGRAMHCGPVLPHRLEDLERRGTGESLVNAGMAITIEPVVAWSDTDFVRSGWVDRTSDSSDACFHEVTVLVGSDRSEVVAGGGDDAVDRYEGAS
ncbi:MAG: M24 family metallopeptidase [Phycisphaerales bacterium]